MKKEEIYTLLGTEFSKIADSSRAKQQQRYMKSTMPFYGISVPQATKTAQKIFLPFKPADNKEYRETLRYLFKKARYREEWYAALAYATKWKSYIIEDNIDVYLSLIKISQWWDVVDNVAQNLIGPALLNSKNVGSYLTRCITDKNLWIRRTALLTQLKYKEKTDWNLLKKLILTVMDENEFFMQKAIGWALRQYSYIGPKQVIGFIKEYEDLLSSLSKREGQKAISRNKNL